MTNGAEKHDKVTFHYTLKYKNGVIFDSTRNKEPITIIIGQGHYIPGLESGLIGMEVGQLKVIELKPEKAFGPILEDLIITMDRHFLPNDLELDIGKVIHASKDDDSGTPMTVIELTDTTVTLDANPPQAGQDFFLSLEMIDIEPGIDLN